MKVLLTGGHFSPAYSVIKELQKRGDQVVVVGRKYPFEGNENDTSYEYRVSNELQIPFVEFTTGRLQRTLSLYTIMSFFKFIRGIYHAFRILNIQKPDVVLTFGGYLSLPIAVVARIRNIPLVIHEQTQNIGLSNRIISHFANVICVSFPNSKKIIKRNNVVVTGNPIRSEIFTESKKIEIPKDMPVIYVTGGSTGSHVINLEIKKIAAQLLEKFVLIHQTGKNEFHDFEVLNEVKDSLPDQLANRYILKTHILPDEIGFVYKHADLIIGRSGANTILELIATNKPSILIPLPHGQKGEQKLNAQLISSIGLGEVIYQNQLNSNTLYEAILNMYKNIEKYHISHDIIDTYIVHDAAKKIVGEVQKQYEKKPKK